MNARSILLTQAGVLRAPWRIVGFIAAAGLCSFVAAALFGRAIEWILLSLGVRGATNVVILALGLLGAHAVMLLLVDHRPWESVAMGRFAARPAAWPGGFVLGALAIGIPILVSIAVGWEGRQAAPAGSWTGAAFRTSVFLLPAALWEELLLRGYVLAVIREAAGAWSAVLATSLFFGVMHVSNPGATVESTVLVTLAGIFLGVVVLATRSLYAAWMAHFAWNWTMAVVFHTAVSGLPVEAPNYRYVDAGPDWLTGGPWGPEGGALAGVGMLSGLTYLIARQKRRGEQ